MKVAERAALVDRIARALSWIEQPDATRAAARARAAKVVDEIEQGHRDDHEIAWMLLDPDEAET